MDTGKVYQDSDGNDCSIVQMVSREPYWAANRVQEGEKAIEQLATLKRQRDMLLQVARNTYEVWAGSEGIPQPETAAEAYLLRLIEQMRNEAKIGLHNALEAVDKR